MTRMPEVCDHTCVNPDHGQHFPDLPEAATIIF
jgi:hypothetical protein